MAQCRSKVVCVSDAEILHAQEHLKFSIFSIIHGGGLLKEERLKVFHFPVRRERGVSCFSSRLREQSVGNQLDGCGF